MGVIEHIPSSPRLLLDALNRVRWPARLLVIDTPNLVHLENRQKFARGETVLADIQAQYETELPFEGHHREYTIPECVWLLRRIGHVQITVEAFNYSSYALCTLFSRDVHNHWNMVRDPAMREYLMTVSAKPAEGAVAVGDTRDWRALIEDPEQAWLRALPAAMTDQPRQVDVDRELQLVKMQDEINRRDVERAAVQHEVNVRDQMIRDLHDRFVHEVQRRDEIIDRLNREQDWMRRGWRRFVIRRPRSGYVRHCRLVWPGRAGSGPSWLACATAWDRGPDGVGIWCARIELHAGHRRLSIIDLSSAAAQPMVNDDGTVAVTFNGEIYNHAEVRKELEGLGKYRWRTDHSDTEMLLHAYEEWGFDCVNRFYGMFAFAVFDGRDPGRPVMHLIRDRVGIKPLYLTRTAAGEWLFASEIRALLAHPDVTPEWTAPLSGTT
jgi:hypothetical protein